MQVADACLSQLMTLRVQRAYIPLTDQPHVHNYITHTPHTHTRTHTRAHPHMRPHTHNHYITWPTGVYSNEKWQKNWTSVAQITGLITVWFRYGNTPDFEPTLVLGTAFYISIRLLTSYNCSQWQWLHRGRHGACPLSPLTKNRFSFVQKGMTN